ncbi:putative ribonuclease H-like domain-containing protein [Tanacetum coccineum]|uniref:Ribonuclease H-like domain-containing protein n=1 Tax=Tanacetum coccineum TaxID=301880 RepID=A0ABQ5B3U3_9ASTR
MPCWQSLSFPKAFSMAEIVSKEAQKKSKAGICLRFPSHNKHTSFLLSKRSTSCKSKTSAINKSLLKNEVLFSEEVAVLIREVACKDYEINVLKKPEFKSYGSEDSTLESNIVCDKKLDDSKENSDDSLVKEQVSKDTSSFVESPLNVDKETLFLVDKKIEFVKLKNHEKPVKKLVRYAEMYRSQSPRGNQRNWNGKKSNQLGSDFVMYNKACFICGSFDHVQTHYTHKIPEKTYVHFDMKNNVFLKRILTVMYAKMLTLDNMLWHRRLGHINFKNINKLVKDNLVRGLPIKRFENNQTCVACLKGKQHRAFCKFKVLNPSTNPLFMLHMDLFGPTFVSSLMHKKYCLVVTDDYSRFTWVFFLTTKDETSEILKNFIKEIENLVDKKVKIIRSDDGTEFKNKVIDDFYIEKGIKREYSIAMTPQQNGVVERRNMKLIEATRTMLADSKLPTIFWAEAVSTACYVQNRVLVVKPYNKTPYELFRGLKPALSFMRPFGCHVTILNNLDNLGKFDGKSDEGFFVGYSLSVNAGTISNESTGTQGELNAGASTQKEEISQDCIVMPIWKVASYFDSPSKDVGNGEPKSAYDDQKYVEDGPHNESDEKDKSEDDSSPKEVNTAGQLN